MAKPRIFISSTCFDLGMLRSELRPFIVSMGYEPIMSEYSDILYDPRSHTHVSCINEVASCDLLVLILGRRFGGAATESALECFNFEALSKESSSSGIFEQDNKFSITQLEVLKAIENSVPIYAFVEDKVYYDHLVYEKNKHDLDLIGKIKFPSIQKNETAKYIFEFINYLSHRVHNNTITPFSRLDDIRINLISQWSQLYQRLLSESRVKQNEIKQYQNFSERLEDLKAVVLASITTPDLRQIAKSAVQFRHLVSFVSALYEDNHLDVLKKQLSWDDMLLGAGVVAVTTMKERSSIFDKLATFLIRDDGTFYRCKYSSRMMDDLKKEWSEFLRLDPKARDVIAEALVETVDDTGRSLITHMEMQFDEYLDIKKGATPGVASFAIGE